MALEAILRMLFIFFYQNQLLSDDKLKISSDITVEK